MSSGFKRLTRKVFESNKLQDLEEVYIENSQILSLNAAQSKAYGFPDRVATNLAYDKY
jgi:hypothetical protein